MVIRKRWRILTGVVCTALGAMLLASAQVIADLISMPLTRFFKWNGVIALAAGAFVFWVEWDQR